MEEWDGEQSGGEGVRGGKEGGEGKGGKRGKGREGGEEGSDIENTRLSQPCNKVATRLCNNLVTT